MAPRILLISFSDLGADARVSRQLSVVSELGDVTTVTHGAHPAGATEHIEIPRKKLSLPLQPLGVVGLGLHAYQFTELRSPAAQYALARLQGRQFDLVIANDARALPLAFAVAGDAPVWADLHEWAPEERTHFRAWRRWIAPLMTDICARYLPRCAATTTVGGAIADLYEQHFGVRPRLVRNIPRYSDLSPTPVGNPIRLVHSGAATPGRNLEAMFEAVELAGARFTLDLYLIASPHSSYWKDIRAAAAGSSRIRFQKPVAPSELPATLNQYDVGVFWIPPFNTNARLTLPNKFFDYVQARLAIAVGPTVEMANLVHHHGLGVVSTGFTAPEAAASLATLTPEKVAACKEASHAAARELNFEKESETITDIVNSLL